MKAHGSLYVKHIKEVDFISLQDKHPYFSKAYLLIVYNLWFKLMKIKLIKIFNNNMISVNLFLIKI